MKQYDNSAVRRQDRLLDESQASELIVNGEYGFLSLIDNGQPYGIPISYVYDGKDSIYFHCAPEGKKLKLIEQNPSAIFCIVGQTAVQPSKFTTAYESVLISGKIQLIEDDRERMSALLLLVDKYSPEYKEIGAKYAQGSFARTAILRLDIEHISGKCKVIPAKNNND